jgi:hypothetical protein
VMPQNDRIIPPPAPRSGGAPPPRSGIHAAHPVAVQQTPGWGLGGLALGGLAAFSLGTGLLVGGGLALIGGVLGHVGSDLYYREFYQATQGVLSANETRLIAKRGQKTSAELDTIFKSIEWLPQLVEFSLTSCQFPGSWSTRKFSSLRRLQRFTLYNPQGDPSTPEDRLAGLAHASSLREVSLFRCPFAMHCFDNIASLRQITRLDLTRSLAIEKFPGESREPAVRALGSLIEAGELRELVLDYCTGLFEADVDRLKKIAENRGCTVKAKIRFRG